MTVLPQLEHELRAAHRRTARRRRRASWLAPAVAVAASIAVAAVFVIAVRHGRSTAGDYSGTGQAGTVVLQSTPVNPLAPLGPAVATALTLLQHRYAAALPTVRVSRTGNGLVLHGVTAATRARALALAVPGRLAFYDWEGNLLMSNGKTLASGLKRRDPAALLASQGSSGGLGVQGSGGLALYWAVRLAQRVPTHPDPARSHAGAQLYLFGAPNSRLCAGHPDAVTRRPCYLAGPAPTLDALTRGLPLGTAAAGTILTVPPDAVILQAADASPGRHLAVSNPAARFFVLRDHEALGPSEITDPVAGTDQAGGANVVFRFTPAGTAAFRRVTQVLARRGVSVSSNGQALNQHLAIALDGRLLSLPQIDFKSYPDGITTSSADVSGAFTATSAHDLAVILRFGPLPVTLTAP